MTGMRLQRHLNDDEMLLALAESDALVPEALDHVTQCSDCRHALEQLRQRMDRLGDLARRFTPEPKRPFRLPRSRSARSRWLIPVMASGLTAALVLIVSIWWIPPPGREAGPVRMISSEQLAADRALMAEVDQLVENAMPEPFRELAAISDPSLDWDQDLIDWIVPSIEEDSEPMS